MCFFNSFWHLLVEVILLLFLMDAAREQLRSQLESVFFFLLFYFRIIQDSSSTCVRLVACRFIRLTKYVGIW